MLIGKVEQKHTHEFQSRNRFVCMDHGLKNIYIARGGKFECGFNRHE